MRVRLDAARKDLLLTGALLIWVLLQAALLPLAMSERVATLVVGCAVCGSVAIRRRF